MLLSRRWQEWTSTFRNQWTKLMRMANLIQMTIVFTTLGKNHLEEMDSPHTQQESLKCGTWVLSQNWQNDLVSFKGKPFNITVIQVYAPTTNAKEAESWTVLWRPTRPSRTNNNKKCPSLRRELKCEMRKSRNTCSNRQVWPWNTKWSRTKANRVLPKEHTGHS